MQQAVQQVGGAIWSWRVARVGANYKIVDRVVEGGLQLGRVFCVCASEYPWSKRCSLASWHSSSSKKGYALHEYKLPSGILGDTHDAKIASSLLFSVLGA